MSRPLLTADEVRCLIHARYPGWSFAQIARELGLSPEFIRLILHGDREPSGRFLAAAGFERVTFYRAKRRPRR